MSRRYRDLNEEEKAKYKERAHKWHVEHREEVNERKRKYRAEHREEFHERQRKRRRKYRDEHLEECRERQRKRRAEHLEEFHERQRKRRGEHREEHNERKRNYIAKDLTSSGKTKHYIRTQSHKYLLAKHSRIPGYEIHHCFGYEDPKRFIYVPKTLHTEIHMRLRDLRIKSDTNHWMAIRDMVNSCDEYTYISC